MFHLCWKRLRYRQSKSSAQAKANNREFFDAVFDKKGLYTACPEMLFKRFFVISPGALSMKEQVERIKCIGFEMRSGQSVENIFILSETMKKQHNLLTITDFSVMKVGLLVVKEIV